MLKSLRKIVSKRLTHCMLPFRDEPILLFFSPTFLSGDSFFLTYYAQHFAQSLAK